MAELLKENEEFKKQLNQNDDTITELDLELRDVKLKLEEALSKIDGKLSPLVGALKVHEVFIGDDLVIKKKNLPSDPFYKAVLIKESRRRLSAPANNDDMESDVE